MSVAAHLTLCNTYPHRTKSLVDAVQAEVVALKDILPQDPIDVEHVKAAIESFDIQRTTLDRLVNYIAQADQKKEQEEKTSSDEHDEVEGSQPQPHYGGEASKGHPSARGVH